MFNLSPRGLGVGGGGWLVEDEGVNYQELKNTLQKWSRLNFEIFKMLPAELSPLWKRFHSASGAVTHAVCLLLVCCQRRHTL